MQPLSTPVEAQIVCPACGAGNAMSDFTCALCSGLLRAPDAPAPGRPPEEDWQCVRTARTVAIREPLPWKVLAWGLPLAAVFWFTPLLQYMAWFLASLVHELGHCAVAWITGHPAFPAIRLDGHAVAVHREQSLLLALAISGILAAVLHAVWAHRRARVWVAMALGLQLLLTFTGVGAVMHLLGGHLGELAFGGLFLWRSLTRGFTDGAAERIVSAAVGFMLIGRNVIHCTGLLTSDAARALYRTNGSFGLENDYLRVAHHHWGIGVQTVAGVMLVASLLVIPAVLWLWSRRPVA